MTYRGQARQIKMSKPSRNARRLDIFGGILAALTLLVIIGYSKLFLTHPELGFRVKPGSWEVLFVDEGCADPNRCLAVGDRVLRIGDIPFESAQKHRSQPLIKTEWFEDGRTAVEVEAMRGDELITRSVTPMTDSPNIIQQVLMVLFPLLFWLTGTMAVLFLRPRDERWFAFVGFQYVTALWTSAGFLSATRLAYSSVLFHAVIWFFLPLSIHLHAVFARQSPKAGQALAPDPSLLAGHRAQRARRPLSCRPFMVFAHHLHWHAGFVVPTLVAESAIRPQGTSTSPIASCSTARCWVWGRWHCLFSCT